MSLLKVCYLSMDSLEGFECYDKMTFNPLRKLGFSVDEVSWKKRTDWNKYDYVLIRSTWDYQDHISDYISVLTSINDSSATLINPLHVILWNINKTYLSDLEKESVAIVPTFFSNSLTMDEIMFAYDSLNTTELIFKPTVSANADDTYRVPFKNLEGFVSQHLAKFINRQCMIQPFITSVVEEGEFSLFYFNGKISHCILKTPKSGDFRVQEEHGGQLKLITSPEKSLLYAGETALCALPEELLYARLDFVRLGNSFILMEAELIEPSLYFNLEHKSPQRFAQAFENYHFDRK